MRTNLYCNEGFVQIAEWKPNCWINVECPDASDLDFLIQELKVPESFLNDIADTDERPRTESEGNWLLTILRVPLPSEQNGIPFVTIPIGIITNDDIIISVCYHRTEMLTDFIAYSRRKKIEVRNKLDLILRLIHSSAVWFLKYLKQISNDIKLAEKELEKSIRNEDLHRLMKLQNTLVYFNTSLRGNQVMIGRLRTIFQDTNYLDKELLEDVVIELEQAISLVNIYSDILTGTMDAFASIISNNVNTIMKRMTSISIILMVPTLIASFYGMNVDIHLDRFPHAFTFIVLVSLLLSAMAFFIFKKVKWF
ncbi:magnesium transporter CorA family protein [Bacteroides sp. OttesenSCG-928-E20]|nr:magnesium transporter CorA family protein [Bacteroides sp. OttesenSCG-928-N06]MDL2299742.1 magnesium transporter CorA family protein [Bacteroides sp. OttesenSCG-928-E20]MDL2306140.1 magnesium transporter CorA family protein [Bacteroides sp. OttesenSCG-928-D19]